MVRHWEDDESESVVERKSGRGGMHAPDEPWTNAKASCKLGPFFALSSDTEPFNSCGLVKSDEKGMYFAYLSDKVGLHG